MEWRTYRPKLRHALDLLAKGENDGFIPLDLDRAFRDPRDLEDLIDIAEEYGVPVESVTGSLRLGNDATSPWRGSWWRWQQVLPGHCPPGLGGA